MAGNPPAEASQPSGIKGIIVTVVKKVTAEPAAPRIPSRLSQKPANVSVVWMVRDFGVKRQDGDEAIPAALG
jgi:hypothetical protein